MYEFINTDVPANMYDIYIYIYATQMYVCPSLTKIRSAPPPTKQKQTLFSTPDSESTRKIYTIQMYC